MTDSGKKKCPLCISSGLMTTIIWEDDDAYLCHRVEFPGGKVKVMENEYMLVPKHHVEDEPSWLSAKAQLALKQRGIEPDTDYTNHTEAYGRQLEHFHRHYIVRTDPFKLGLNGMIALATQQQAKIQELEAALVEARQKAGMQLTGL